ncbi:enoyl-CoA hydratase [Methylopila turkensis]|uniref:Enoyl-CoA hydratase n=1 Tax=Methylopila turkensis TaxID=1437816 RepID=A0A9W6N5N4_9HYPH|nr:enoyl-CoA hydratase [Methylopila turkensis]
MERARARLAAAREARGLSDHRSAPARAGAAEPSTPTPSTYEEIDFSFDAADGAYWCWMNPKGAPSFTPGMLTELASYTATIRAHCARAETDAGVSPPKQAVLASRIPGVYNLGGDLERFSRWIVARDREALTEYAYSCIHVLHDNAIGFGNPILTIALVQGDALGGGFETALSCHMIVAERGVKFGFPEILFNLFPGMGASSLLTRRVGLARAENMIASGRIFTAEELYEMGLVQVLAEPGDGVDATRRLIRQNQKRHNGLTAMLRASARVSPMPYEELRDVTDIWVEAALELHPADLRKMQRLVTAQDRRMTAAGVRSPASEAEIA